MTSFESLLGELKAAPQEINRILAENPLPGLQAVRPNGDWNAHQILAHLRDVNREVYFPRLEQIINQVNPNFAEFDGVRWMQEHYDPAEPLEKLLNEFKGQCEGTASWLENLPAADWQRLGTHVSLGCHSFQWWADRMVAHIAEHLAQLRGIAA